MCEADPGSVGEDAAQRCMGRRTQLTYPSTEPPLKNVPNYGVLG